MKNVLFLVGALVVGAVSAHVSNAAPAPGPKRPGPSAVQAARLKKYPPGGYLSHYLPDDRYKIAGGVWKYVSTDLDTYYHVPSSPNMMRQPSNRVLGFANARDAEEAGYVADPTDGTSNRASSVGFNSFARLKSQGSTRVLLADGKTTITLPSGWKVIDKNRTSGTLPLSGISQPYTGGNVHLVYGGNLENTVMVLTTTTPGRSASKETDFAVARERIRTSGTNGTVTALNVGKFKGSIIRTPPFDANSPANTSIQLGRGETMHSFALTQKNEALPGLFSIVRSLR